MTVLAFVFFTLAVFALLGYLQRMVER